MLFSRISILSILAIFCSSQIFGNNQEEIVIKKPKILIYLITFGYSHFNFDCTIARWLSEAGYEVHSITPNFVDFAPMKCDAVVKNYDFNVTSKLSKTFFSTFNYGVAEMVSNGVKLVLAENCFNMCEGLYQQSSELMEIIIKENYTIGISEYMDSCISTFFSKIGAKTLVNLSPTAIQAPWYKNMGIALSPAIVPAVDETFSSGDRMSYLERIWNLYCAYFENYVNTPAFDRSFVSCFPSFYFFGEKFSKK